MTESNIYNINFIFSSCGCNNFQEKIRFLKGGNRISSRKRKLSGCFRFCVHSFSSSIISVVLLLEMLLAIIIITTTISISRKSYLLSIFRQISPHILIRVLTGC